MSQRFEGRNLEDALNAAAEALGVERWQLTYHVLVQKRGFLGGVKRIVIEAETNLEAAPPVAAPPSPPAPHASAPPAPRERKRGGGRGERRGGSREGGRDRDRGGRRGRRDDGRAPRRHRPETLISDLPEQEPRSEGAAKVATWIETTFELADLDLVLRTEETDEQIAVRIYGADADRLLTGHGELLDAIQVLANKALVGRSVGKEIELDCEGFKERRVTDLEEQAREVADRVRRGRSEEILPAMTPIERRIVHVALQDDPDVTTESRGEGFYKRVAVVLRADRSATEPQPGEP